METQPKSLLRMKKYVVLSADGYEEDCSQNRVYNLQVIGFYHADSPEDAVKQAVETCKVNKAAFYTFRALELAQHERIH